MQMDTLKYKVITSERQYDNYCKILEQLLFSTPKSKAINEEVALLTLLIETWDKGHSIFNQLEPVALLKSLMKEHQLKSLDIAKKLNVSRGLVSDILNHKKGFSKEVIRKLSELFKLSQEAFNKPYKLNSPVKAHLKDASVINTAKELNAA